MKVDQFKNLIKESIKEVLVEEGLLTEVITTVIQETTKASTNLSEKVASTNVVTKNAPNENLFKEMASKNLKKLDEMRSKMSDSIGKSSYSNLYNLEGIDLFEGTTPLSKGGSPGDNLAGQGPLSGVEPDDAGVSIDSLLGNKKIWQQLLDKK